MTSLRKTCPSPMTNSLMCSRKIQRLQFLNLLTAKTRTHTTMKNLTTWCLIWQLQILLSLPWSQRLILTKQLSITMLETTDRAKTYGSRKKKWWERSWRRVPSHSWRAELHSKTGLRGQIRIPTSSLFKKMIMTVIWIPMKPKIMKC